MASLFNNNASERMALAALDTYISVLDDEVKKAKNLKRIIQSPPRTYKPSALTKNDGDVEHVKNMTGALLRKTLPGGATNGKSYRSTRTTTLTLQSDTAEFKLTNANVPGDYKVTDISANPMTAQTISVTLANADTALTLEAGTASPTAQGMYTIETTTESVTVNGVTTNEPIKIFRFHEDDNTMSAVIAFSYETNHVRDAALRHIRGELEQHVSTANLMKDSS